MGADELRKIQEKLAEIDREAQATDAAVDDLKRAATEANQEVEDLKVRAERVRSRLAAAS